MVKFYHNYTGSIINKPHPKYDGSLRMCIKPMRAQLLTLYHRQMKATIIDLAIDTFCIARLYHVIIIGADVLQAISHY